MSEGVNAQFTLLDETSSMKGAKGPRSNGQKRQLSIDGPLAVSSKGNTETESRGTKPLETKVYFADEGEKENICTPEQARKSRSICKEGLQAACLLEQFRAESPDQGVAAHISQGPRTPPQTPPRPTFSLRSSISSPPVTPGRFTRTPQSKPPQPWSPPNQKKASPIKGSAILCTPPRPRTVHQPYRWPGSPAPCQVNSLCSPQVRASPKPRTPSRTRNRIILENTPSQGIATPQARLNMALRGTPTHSEPGASPLISSGSQTKADLSLTTATHFLQCAAGAEHLPPSLQYRVGYDLQNPLDGQFDYGAQFSSANELLQCASPSYSLDPQVSLQYAVHGAMSPTMQYAQIQGATSSSPLASQYSPASLGQYSAGVSPNARFTSQLLPGSPSSQSSQYGVMLQSPNMPYSSNPTTPQQVPNKIYVLVQFKRGRTVQFQSDFLPQSGEYLMVDGDEGQDMGVVVRAWVAAANSPPVVNNSLNSNKASSGRDIDPTTGERIYPNVLRRATAKEVQYMLNVLEPGEIKCIETAKNKVLEHRLPMTIIDAEYQFDRKKLTFYYDAGERVDFRDLIRDLFKIYRARIWMSKIRTFDGFEERRPR